MTDGIQVVGWDVIEGRIAKLPEAVQDEVNTAVGDYGVDVLRASEPQRVQHGPGNPYQWQSEKQRRAYFATDGFGAGIPYRRTGNFSQAWSAKAGATNGYIRNSTTYADFVMGRYAQRGHLADKWQKLQDIIDGKLSFRSSSFRAAVQGAIRLAIGKLKLG